MVVTVDVHGVDVVVLGKGMRLEASCRVDMRVTRLSAAVTAVTGERETKRKRKRKRKRERERERVRMVHSAIMSVLTIDNQQPFSVNQGYILLVTYFVVALIYFFEGLQCYGVVREITAFA